MKMTKQTWYWIGGIVLAIIIYRWYKRKNGVKLTNGSTGTVATGVEEAIADTTTSARRFATALVGTGGEYSYYNSGGFCRKATYNSSGDITNIELIGPAHQGPCANVSAS